MTCRECLDKHSEYLDRRLSDPQAARCREHLDRCASCADYDRVLRRGLMALSGLESVRPTARARRQLIRRLRLEGLQVASQPWRAVSVVGRT